MTEKQKLQIEWAIGVLEGLTVHVDKQIEDLLVLVMETLDLALNADNEEN